MYILINNLTHSIFQFFHFLEVFSSFHTFCQSKDPVFLNASKLNLRNQLHYLVEEYLKSKDLYSLLYASLFIIILGYLNFVLYYLL